MVSAFTENGYNLLTDIRAIRFVLFVLPGYENA